MTERGIRPTSAGSEGQAGSLFPPDNPSPPDMLSVHAATASQVPYDSGMMARDGQQPRLSRGAIIQALGELDYCDAYAVNQQRDTVVFTPTKTDPVNSQHLLISVPRCMHTTKDITEEVGGGISSRENPQWCDGSRNTILGTA